MTTLAEFQSWIQGIMAQPAKTYDPEQCTVQEHEDGSISYHAPDGHCFAFFGPESAKALRAAAERLEKGQE